VSDFGLARTALGEGNEHISTRVMGTFGYVESEFIIFTISELIHYQLMLQIYD
jgi:hypothetical protein